MRVLDPARLAKVPMTAIIEHWTAGGSKANSVDVRSYHALTQGDGSVVYGVDIALNSGGTKPGYAAHTRGGNTNRIGHSMCGMMGAVESPWNPGAAPITLKQWNSHVLAAADLCEFYKIAVARDKLLFHAEVQSTLGIKQNGKWDVTRLPFDESVRGARVIGDRFRDEVLAALRGNVPLPAPEPVPASMAGATGRVTAASLNFRRGPGTSHESTGSIPAGTLITLLGIEGDWFNVETPAGYRGWVHGGYVQLLDTAPLPNPTVPDPLRAEIEEIQRMLERIDENMPADRMALAIVLAEVRRSLTSL